MLIKTMGEVLIQNSPDRSHIKFKFSFRKNVLCIGAHFASSFFSMKIPPILQGFES